MGLQIYREANFIFDTGPSCSLWNAADTGIWINEAHLSRSSVLFSTSYVKFVRGLQPDTRQIPEDQAFLSEIYLLDDIKYEKSQTLHLNMLCFLPPNCLAFHKVNVQGIKGKVAELGRSQNWEGHRIDSFSALCSHNLIP